MRVPFLLPALFAALALAAAPAGAARVSQVRVGDHTDFTRIVIELDGPAGYGLEQKEAGGVAELVLELDASTAGRIVSSRSRLVESVTLQPGPRGAEARIQLRSGRVNVKEMVLKSPHRIVLDLSPAAPGAAAAPAPRAPAARAAPPAPAIEPAPALAAARAAESTPPTATPAPAPAQRPALRAEPPVVAAAPSEPEPAAPADEAAEPPASGEPVASGEAEAPGSEGADAGEATASGEAAPPIPPREPPRMRKPERASAPEREPEPGWAETLGGGDPMVGLSIVLGGIAFLLLAFLTLRRRSARLAREAAAAPWPPPGAEERPELARAAAPEEALPAGPLFAEPEEEPEPGEAGAPPVVLPQASLHEEPEVVAKDDAVPQLEELERRIERLEARLADSLDARERVERQLAAHTEELRVQRAAIARTQRAVRAAVRGPEGAAPGTPAPAAGVGQADPGQQGEG